MANLQPIQKVAKLALETFKYVNKGDKHVFLDKLEALCTSMNRIRAADVGVDLTANRGSSPATAPVGYMFIAENSAVSMGVFVVERGCRLPLHDHNGMHGVIKVLSGTIRMQSYDLLTDEELNSVKIPESDGTILPSDAELGLTTRTLIPARKKAEFKVTPESKPCVLSPTESNVHSLESVDGPAAFLDVLSPPYDPEIGRDCFYYKETTLMNSKETSVNLKWLQRIPQPTSFWCHQQSYLGPAVNLEQL